MLYTKNSIDVDGDSSEGKSFSKLNSGDHIRETPIVLPILLFIPDVATTSDVIS